MQLKSEMATVTIQGQKCHLPAQQQSQLQASGLLHMKHVHFRPPSTLTGLVLLQVLEYAILSLQQQPIDEVLQVSAPQVRHVFASACSLSSIDEQNYLSELTRR